PSLGAADATYTTPFCSYSPTDVGVAWHSSLECEWRRGKPSRTTLERACGNLEGACRRLATLRNHNCGIHATIFGTAARIPALGSGGRPSRLAIEIGSGTRSKRLHQQSAPETRARFSEKQDVP